ncbi:type IV secretion system DNA-binding domain-containing protein [Limnohabitans sp.]|uniref:type IV secretion system DNA-binding domain-containing protein n=1 Tax=Limnohabitans sp. TaxID=1907725 RepID=UPI00286FA9B4|nr:type IV secretion system DNA-binding domain-containing protein [Limnohabitans sp.]
MRRTVIDFGFNVIPYDPQTLRRDFWGACFVGALGLLGGFAATWAGLGLAFPTSVGAMAFLKALTAQDLPLFSSLALRGGLCLTVAGMFGAVGFAEAFKPRERLTHIRGNRLLEGREAIKKAKRLAQQEQKQGGGLGVRLSQDIEISAQRTGEHLLIVGGVGAGKTTIAHHLLRDIFARGDRALIVDWKGDFTAAYRGQIFNPLDARSKKWAVAKDVVTELDAHSFAGRIIPDREGGGDSYFTTAGRSVLTALVIKLQNTKPLEWTWSDLYKEAAAGYDSIREAVVTYYPHAVENIAEPGKQTQGVLSQIMAEFDVVRVLAAAEATTPKNIGSISAAEWLSKEWKTPQLILAGVPAHERLGRAYMSAFITAAAAKLMSLPDSRERAVWFIADEFPKLGKVDAIPSLIEFGRSKGARVVLLTQDIAQIRKIYGADTAKTFGSMMGTKIVCKTEQGETADTISKQWIGTREVERRNITSQGNGASSSSWQRDELLVVAPSELKSTLGKDGDHINALVLGFGGYVFNLPFNFVGPATSRESIEWRDCFDASKRTTLKVEEEPIQQQVTHTKEAEHEDGNNAEKEAVHHIFEEAIDPFSGGLLAALGAIEMAGVKTRQPTAAPTHSAQRLKVINEEQELGD